MTGRMATTLVVSALLAGACQLTDPDTATVDPTPTVAASPHVADATAAPSPTGPPASTSSSEVPEVSDAPDVPHDLADCSAVQVAAIDEVIGNQLQAFSAGDYAEALAWTTPGFRRGFSPESFREMITQEFPVPAAATDHEVLSCTVVDRLAVTTVEVTGPAGQQSLEYGLQLVEGTGWRIGGALPLGGPATGDTII